MALLGHSTTSAANIEVNRYRVIQDEPNNGFLSDHYPILVKLAFK